MLYLAHRTEDGKTQTLKEHLENVAALAASFAQPFQASELAYLIGLLHDLGKYSALFQKRIRGEYNGSVDHSTAGGQLLYQTKQIIPAYCIMGHHAGLMNGGTGRAAQNLSNDSTLFSRLYRSIENYDGYSTEIAVPKANYPPIVPTPNPGMSISMLIRMLYSALVDADFLDTEAFMSSGQISRPKYDSIETLAQRFEAYITKFENPKNDIHKKRNQILADCLHASERDRGLFSLTVPTGGGKTISSLGFALRHAKKHGMQHIIYVIPYTSIIEQNAAVIGDIIGAENVVEHHSSVNYEDTENGHDKKYLSTENWDAPVVITTNVQFFESLFANRSSKCRKLHNIANSVIIFDEAQMLPIPYLRPCVQTIAELVKNYAASAVLCTATQPALDSFFLPELQRTEICTDPQALYAFFRRATIKPIGQLSDDLLVERLQAEKQVLCIVNTRKHAQLLFEKLGEGYHLSTLMIPAHRKAVIDAIKADLHAGRPCKVISTSLVEAGVDLDFETVYREENGLDSVIQAAGRCNREGKRPASESMVYVFRADADYKLPKFFEQLVSGFQVVTDEFEDISSIDAIHRYFQWLYIIKAQALDQLHMIDRMNDGWQKGGGSFPFQDVAQEFRMIDENTYPVFVIYDKYNNDSVAATLHKRMMSGERSRALLRAIGQYSVNVHENHLNLLLQNGQVEFIDQDVAKKTKDGIFILRDMSVYDDNFGLKQAPDTGYGLFT